MQVENLTGNTYFLGRGDLQLDPLETMVVSDALYNGDDAVAQAINELDEENKVTVTSPPVGYPREVDQDGGGGGGGLSEEEVQDLIDEALDGFEGGLTQEYLGYNTVGASWTGHSENFEVAKLVTVASPGLMNSIGYYVKGNDSNVGGFGVALMEDNAGTPGKTMFYHTGWQDTAYLTSTGRWLSFPCGLWLPAASYWIVAYNEDATNNDAQQIAYDEGGTDKGRSDTGGWISDGSIGSWSTSTRHYSLRASMVR